MSTGSIDSWKSKYDDLKTQFDTLKTEYEELKQFSEEYEQQTERLLEDSQEEADRLTKENLSLKQAVDKLTFNLENAL